MMRLSVRKNDPGYSPAAFGAKVTLNGVPLDNCITADEELGVALCYDVDASGKPYLDPADPSRAATIERRGVVKIALAS